MNLHRFANEKGAGAISADRLDDNFARLKPLPQDGAGRQYSITETPDGWKLIIYSDQLNVGEAVDQTYGEPLVLVEVERCDGKRMKVLGTGWYDP
jgi:hypothetical protein